MLFVRLGEQSEHARLKRRCTEDNQVGAVVE
jgi:hypothetical protein